MNEEPYVDADELGRLMGVSRTTIWRWVRRGMPSETWGMGHTRRFLASRCIAWAQGQDDRIPGRIVPTRPAQRSNARRGTQTQP